MLKIKNKHPQNTIGSILNRTQQSQQHQTDTRSESLKLQRNMTLEVVFTKNNEPGSDKVFSKQCINTTQNSWYAETDETTLDVESPKDSDGACVVIL